ncbi:MAG: hypothetical protein IJ874_06095 [Ruminococcus sp.]|nr:hypothetical protein [Ruminococcus sp.]
MKKLLTIISAALLSVLTAAMPCAVLSASAGADGGFTAEEIEASEIKPLLSLPKIELSEEELAASHNVLVTLTVSDANRKYASSEIWTVFDSRLSLPENPDGSPAVSAGDAVRLLSTRFRKPSYYDSEQKKLIEQNGVRVITAGSANYGLDGYIYTISVTLPDNAKPGDVYPLRFFYADSETTHNKFTNSMFTNKANDDTGKLMQAWTFTNGLSDGYIRILGESPEPDYGDANLDGKVNLADAVAVLQFLTNSGKFPLSEEGYNNADVCQRGDGLTASDAISIQRYDAKEIPALPESWSQ